MKLSELKNIIANIDDDLDDLDILAAPMVVLPFRGKIGGEGQKNEPENGFIKVTSPSIQFRIVCVKNAGIRTSPGNYENFIVLGFDADEPLKIEKNEDESQLIG
jgi:hypothetical protein